MIIAERKPIAELVEMTRDHEKVLVLGCRGCVTVCSAGGEREVELLASLLRLGAQKEGRKIQVQEGSLVRQCDKEFVDSLDNWDGEYDAIVSMACGVGVNFIANLRMLERAAPRGEGPMAIRPVSVLIPARNEARNIGRCLRSLLVQDYPLLEVLV